MQYKTIFTYAILGLIISLVGSIIFLLATPPQSYVLFFLFFLLTALIVLTVIGKNFRLKIRLKVSSIVLYAFLSIASIALVILQLANIHVEAINAILYVIVFIFALGLSLLSIFKFKPNFSRIEFLALASPLSLAFLAIFGAAALILPSYIRGQIESIAIMIISIAAFILKRKEKQNETHGYHELTLNSNMLILFTTLITFAFIFVELYPQITAFLGLDIAGNFIQALAFTKDTLGSFSIPSGLYPLFGIYQSSIIYIAKPTIETFQIIAITLNIFVILSFYAMASQYLRRYGDLTPAIATLIWSTFAGFGWLSFFANKLSSPNTPLLTLIGQADVLSYGDITWRRNFFYLSMEATFTLVFAVLYFLKRNDLSKTKQILLITLLITPIPLMHPYGTYLLLPTLLCFAVICRNELKQQLKSTGYSLIIASFALFPLIWILNISGLDVAISILTFSEYFMLGVIIVILTSIGKVPNLFRLFASKFKIEYGRLIIIVVFLLFFACILLWFSGNIPFNFSNLDLFGYVPLFLYPVKLGLTGILAIAASYLLLVKSQYRSRTAVAIMVSALLLIIFSMLIETLQMQYVSEFTFDPGSWFSETTRQNILSFRAERMFELFKIPLALIASIPLGHFITTIVKQKTASITRWLIISGLVSLILISGISSTLLGFTYYHDTVQTIQLSPSELNIINAMQNNIYTNGKAIIISPQTPTSYLDFTGATAIVTEATAAWASKSPELPLFVTRYSETTPTYIYLTKTLDYPALNSYAGNYLAHITNLAQTYLENQDVQIKEINNTSIPTPNSNTALIVPYDPSTMSITEPLNQQEESQYTIASLFFQQDLQSMNSYPEPINYTNVQINETASFNGINSYIRINGTQTNFNKLLVDFTFQPLNLTQNQVIVAKLEWGNPAQKSWEIAQYGKSIAFKISPDGSNETVVSTGDILQLNTTYTVECEYNGASMQIFVNNNLIATQSYQNGIFPTNTDITIGAELYNNQPTSYANMLLKDIQIQNDIPQVTEPVFSVYDLLSSMGLNYTTTLSGDSKSGSYETLILPYDGATTQQILTQLEASTQKNNTRYVAIINANGYGPLLNLFGNETSETFNADQIFASQNYTMQPAIEVPKINLNNNTRTEAQYINNNSSSPLVMTVTQNQLTLIYINIYPLLSQNQLLNPAPLKILTKTLSNYIELYNETTISPWFTEPSLLFTSLQANGTISISSNSIASITLPENQTLNTSSFNTILINSTEITVQNGYGFYTALTASNPSITLQGDQTASLNIKGNVTFLLRQPEITVNGKIQFENFYMLHPPTIFTDGRTTTLSGKITLNIYVSDEYTIALPYKFQSSITVKYETPLMEFNETASFISAIPYIIPIIIFAITLIIVWRTKKRRYREHQSVLKMNQERFK